MACFLALAACGSDQTLVRRYLPGDIVGIEGHREGYATSRVTHTVAVPELNIEGFDGTDSDEAGIAVVTRDSGRPFCLKRGIKEPSVVPVGDPGLTSLHHAAIDLLRAG